MTADFRPVVGFEAYYAVSDAGDFVRTRSQSGRETWKPIRLENVKGYLRAHLCVANLVTKVCAHRAVWEAFNGPIPEGLQINHKNGVKSDNRLSNLEVVTPSENSLHRNHALGKGIGSKCGTAILMEADIPRIKALYASGLSQQIIAARFGVSQITISRVVRGIWWRHV